jgi:hypothetical protein
MGLQNHPGNPKLWTIAHETAQKRKNDGFLVKRQVFGHPYQASTKCPGLENHPENPILWTIAHENGPKM